MNLIGKKFGMRKNCLKPTQMLRAIKSLTMCWKCFLTLQAASIWAMFAIILWVMLLPVLNEPKAMKFYTQWVGMLLECRLKMQRCKIIPTQKVGLTTILHPCVPNLKAWVFRLIGLENLQPAMLNITHNNSPCF